MNKLAISPLPAPFVTVIPIGLVVKVFFPIFTDKDGIFNIFYTQTVNMMLLDCGAPKACTGKTWLNTYVDQLTEEEKSAIQTLENDDAFAFGPSPTFKSTEKVRIPVKIGTVEHVMEVAVVNAEIPLLIGRDEMEKMDIVLHLKKRESYL